MQVRVIGRFSLVGMLVLLSWLGTSRIAAQSDLQSEVSPGVPLAIRTGQALSTPARSVTRAGASVISQVRVGSTGESSVAPAVTSPAGVVYTCDPTISTSICQTLNTTIAGLYRSYFSNANASIYITFGNTALGQSQTSILSMSYGNFRSLLAAAATSSDDATAINSAPTSGPFGIGFVSLSNANARALGFTVRTGLLTDGVTSCNIAGNGCYDGIITISSDLNISGGLYFRTGPPITNSQYDFYSAVEHETDEVLGTSSCAFSCKNTIAPADLFRYHSNQTRSFQAGSNTDSCFTSSTTNACFSIDGMQMLQQYNNVDGEDAGDWKTNCTSPLVQDAEGCPSIAFLDISPTKEVKLLDVIGYTLVGSAQTPTATTSSSISITSTTATVGGSANPNGADTHVWFEYSTNSSMIGSISTAQQDIGSGGGSVGVSANLSGLAASTTYYFQIFASNSVGTNSGAILSFTTGAVPQPPTVSTNTASSITSATAALNGTANPNGLDTHVWFLYSTNSSMSGSISTAQQDIGSGNSSVGVSANLSGLAGSTTYYFQVRASNSAGTSTGVIFSFVTAATPQAPSVSTSTASSITSSTALLNGTANPNSQDTHVWFLYSTNSSMSGSISTTQQDIGSGNSSVGVSANLSGLAGSTTYYFQVWASNSAGTSSGSVLAFVTTAPPQPPSVSTSNASSVTSSTGLLNGTANPNGLDTHVWFLYSTNSSMSGGISTAQQDIGSGTGATAVSAIIVGLAANTTYYYQVWGSNSAGSSQGVVGSFTTQPPPLPDLVVSSLTAPNGGNPGGTINVSMTVANQGNAAAGAFSVEFYFSSTPTISTSAMDTGSSCSFVGLGVGASMTCTTSIGIPGSVAPGTWYLGAIADPSNRVFESNKVNNSRAADTGPIVVSPVTYTVSGNVSLFGGGGLSGVTVTLSGSQAGSTVSDGSGNYSFNLPAGNFILTPAKSGYIFSPVSQSFTLNSNQTATFTALAMQNQVSRAVFRDSHGAVQMTTYPSSSLSSTGGVFASDPSAVEDLNGNVFVTARDTFNSIWANVYNISNSTWTGWVFGGGIIQGAPALAVDSSGKGWIASRDTFNSYWLVSYTNGGGFSTWTPLLGVFSTDPVITSCRDGSVYLIGKDNFNSLWSGHFIPGSAGFQGWQFGGGIIKGKPAATCGGDNAVYIAAEDNFNSNWMARVSGNTWTGWFYGGAITSVTPRIVGLGNGRESIVILDSTDVVWSTTFTEGTGNGWQPWTQVGGVLQDVAPAAVNSQLYFAGKAPNGDLWWWQQAGSQWTWIGNNGAASGALSATPR